MKLRMFRDTDHMGDHGWMWVWQARNGHTMGRADHSYVNKGDCRRIVERLSRGLNAIGENTTIEEHV